MRTKLNKILFCTFMVLFLFIFQKETQCQWNYTEGGIYYAGGNVGINITNPLAQLHVGGPLRLSFYSLENWSNWEFNYDVSGSYFYIDEYGVNRHFVIKSGGNVGIGNTSPVHKLDVNGDASFSGTLYNVGDQTSYPLRFSAIGDNNWGIEYKTMPTGRVGSNPPDYFGMGLRIMDNGSNSFYIKDQYSGNIRMIIKNGCIGIGTTSPDINYRLSVNGSIRAKEIKVETNWSDFVFSKGYHLLSLAELENYIKANNHLPDIPSEQEVKENGVELGDMSAKLLQKVEELTLYVINLNKEKDRMKEEIEKLKEQNKELMNKTYLR